MLKSIACALCLLIFFCTYSQEPYKNGYIVKESGDTIRGLIKDDIRSNWAKGVHFKNNPNESDVYYKTSDILSFYVENGIIFRKVNYVSASDSTVIDKFGKLLVEGYYNLYVLYLSESEHEYFLLGKEGKSYLLRDDKVLTNGQIDKEGNFKNTLYFIGQNCNVDIDKINSMDFSEKEVGQYVNMVNNCIDPSASSHMVIHKTKNEIHILGYAGGIVMGNDNSQLTAQFFVRILNPEISRKFSVNIGASYNRIGYVNASAIYNVKNKCQAQIISLPVQMQYNFTKGIIQPYMYAGFSLANKEESTYMNTPWNFQDKRTGMAIIGGFGIEAYPLPKLFIKADLRYELMLHNPSIGIGYMFK